jgi:hypothetical protein
MFPFGLLSCLKKDNMFSAFYTVSNQIRYNVNSHSLLLTAKHFRDPP